MPRFVLITRHPADCRELAAMLQPASITLRPYPVLQLEEIVDRKGWKKVLRTLPSSDESEDAWLILASPRAAERLVRQAEEREACHITAMAAAVVGDGTAKAARTAGLQVELVGPGTGAGLAAQLLQRWQQPTTAVFACGRERRTELPDTLSDAGHRVMPLQLYGMRPTPPRELPPLGPSLEAVVLTSPRSARYYLEGVGGQPLPCEHWAMGPTTQQAAEAMGIACRIPPQPNLESLAEELCKI
jgi:uroporphyrinogen-III synthase